MTERDVFKANIPMIAEMIVLRRGMSEQEYEDWKQETMEATADRAKEFIKKVLMIIDLVIKEERSGAT